MRYTHYLDAGIRQFGSGRTDFRGCKQSQGVKGDLAVKSKGPTRNTPNMVAFAVKKWRFAYYKSLDPLTNCYNEKVRAFPPPAVRPFLRCGRPSVLAKSHRGKVAIVL